MKLIELINKKTIRINQIASDWEAAVTLAGNVLLDNGIIKIQYINAMIEAVKTIGPYMVVAPGIAIAHAHPEDGAKKIGMCLVSLGNPVYFGSKNNDPVDLIFGLAAVDHDSHIESLRDLATLLQDKDKVKKIRNSTSIEGIIDVLAEL